MSYIETKNPGAEKTEQIRQAQHLAELARGHIDRRQADKDKPLVARHVTDAASIVKQGIVQSGTDIALLLEVDSKPEALVTFEDGTRYYMLNDQTAGRRLEVVDYDPTHDTVGHGLEGVPLVVVRDRRVGPDGVSQVSGYDIESDGYRVLDYKGDFYTGEVLSANDIAARAKEFETAVNDISHGQYRAVGAGVLQLAND